MIRAIKTPSLFNRDKLAGRTTHHVKRLGNVEGGGPIGGPM